MVMRARVILRIKQVEHAGDDDGDGEGGDNDDDVDEEGKKEDEEEEKEDDENITGVGQTVVYWCGDCSQVSKRIFFKSVFLWLG